MTRNILVFSILFLSACSSAISEGAGDKEGIRDFKSCIAAGYPILKTYPAKCLVPGVGTFIDDPSDSRENIRPKVSDPLVYKPACQDLCGDGQCAEIVCMSEGCPCAENADRCPKDCAK